MASAALSAQLEPAARVLDSAIAAGAAPGAVLAVSWRSEHFVHAVGQLAVDDLRPPDGRTLYDMASLTKVVALTTVAMFAVEERKLDLDTPVVHYLPEFARGAGEKTRVTVRDLLLHDSGLPPDPVPPLWKGSHNRSAAIGRALASNLDTVPGARYVYSDLSAITLATILERMYHRRLDRLFAERVARPLGLTRTRFLPPRSWRSEIAPTEIEPVPFHGPAALRGEVHDENAWWLSGVSGHAGLFGDAEDLLRFGEWALWGSLGRKVGGPLQPPSEFATWTVRQNQPEGSSRAIGWDTPSGVSSAGNYMSARSFGHTGFTGTSIWIDPTRDIVIVLLTNRVNPSRITPKFGPIRGVVADAVMRALFPDTPPREPGTARPGPALHN
jgi:CubicO group peptidase (beta-lactamase class C family)